MIYLMYDKRAMQIKGLASASRAGDRTPDSLVSSQVPLINHSTTTPLDPFFLSYALSVLEEFGVIIENMISWIITFRASVYYEQSYTPIYSDILIHSVADINLISMPF